MADVETEQQTMESSPEAQDSSPVKGKKADAAATGDSSSGTPAKKKANVQRSSKPPTAEMVNGAIKSLNERGGSSLQAIKKYMVANYKVDAEKMATYIKKYIKFAVASGALIQTKGNGASGSFKLASDGSSSSHNKKKTSAAKARTTTAKKSSPAKKKKTAVASEKKTTTKAKKSPAKKGATSATVVASPAAVKEKSPSKAKRVAKSPTKKPKAPKPKTVKKVVGSPKSSPKKGGLRKRK